MEISGVGNTHVGRKRKENEDRVLVEPELGIFAVCDGMGGHAAGEVAAEETITQLRKHIRERRELLLEFDGSETQTCALQTLLQESFEEASRQVYRMARSKRGKHGMGTTCSALIIAKGKGVMAHVGDSRIYLMREGNLYQLSEDHTYLREAIRTGMMSEDQARRSPYANVVTRGIGVRESVCPDTLVFDVLEGDTILLCSDGLHRYTDSDPQRLVELLATQELDTTLADLVNYANERGGEDNIGVVVVHAASVGAQGQAEELRRKDEVTNNLNALQHVTLFQHLTMKQLVLALNRFRPVHVAAGTSIVSEGDDGASLYVVVQGEVSVHRNGQEIARLGAGSHFGEMALLNRRPRSATVRAETEVRLLVQERQEFIDLVQQDPIIGLQFLWALSQSLSQRLDDAYLPFSGALDPKKTMQGLPVLSPFR
jgi:serine/threonine protein phosphatase PrpC